MKGGVEVPYDWEKGLRQYIARDKLNALSRLVDHKVRKGKTAKWAVIMLDIIFIILIFVVIGVLNILNKGIDLRTGLMTGIIAFELAIVTFISPIRTAHITIKEVNDITGIQVTGDIMGKIRNTVEQKTSKLEKYLGVIGACGDLATVILKITN